MDAGYFGLLDLAGYPVGAPLYIAAPAGGAPIVAGRQHIPAIMRAIAAQEYERSLLDHSRALDAMRQRIEAASWLRRLEQEHQQRCLQWAAYSILLSEL